MSYASEVEIDAIKTFDSTRIYLTTRNIYIFFCKTEATNTESTDW